MPPRSHVTEVEDPLALKILLAAGRALGSKALVRVKSAHISGISYENIMDVGLNFLERFLANRRFKIYTTMNPMGADLHTHMFSDLFTTDFLEKQKRIGSALMRAGGLYSFTCAPYEAFYVPEPSQYVSWAESSAAVFANSFLGLRTNREGSLSALASAVTGLAPEPGHHLRKPETTVIVEGVSAWDEVKAGALGYLIGMIFEDPVNVKNVPRSKNMIKYLSAALGASGSLPFVNVLAEWAEEPGARRYIVNEKDLTSVLEKLGSTDEEFDTILLGCPHLGFDEIDLLGSKLKARKEPRFEKGEAILALSSRIYRRSFGSENCDYLRAGNRKFFVNACPIFSPLLKSLGVRKVLTNSVKAAHYLKKRGFEVSLRPLIHG